MSALHRITHPTDFTRESEIAFLHALRLAMAAKTELDVLHVDPQPHAVEWSQFPSVSQTLKQWGMSTNGDGPGIRVQKITEYGKEPFRPILQHLDEFPADLIVLATHRREGLDRFMHREIAAKIARRREVETLFVPHGVDGFVSNSTGRLSLRTILVPLDWIPAPQVAVDAAVEIARMLGCGTLELILLHVGDDDLPAVDVPERPGWIVERRTTRGDVVEDILRAAEDDEVDLLVMTTQGHEGFLDALRGSTTERVLQHSPCPVLAVPAASYD